VFNVQYIIKEGYKMKIVSIATAPQNSPRAGVYSSEFLQQQWRSELTLEKKKNRASTAGNKNVPEGFVYSQWRIDEMDCPVEEGMIYQVLSKMPDIEDIDCNLMQRVLSVVHKAQDKQAIENKITALGMTPQPLDQVTEQTAKGSRSANKLLLGLSGVLAAMAEALHFYHVSDGIVALVALISIALCGLETYKKGWVAIRHGNLNINALMSVAVTGALVIGNWPEAAMVMFLFTIAELLEAYSLDRARNAIQSLMNLTPEVASVQQPDGNWRETDIKQIAVGNLVQVKPGERIPLDGQLIEGASSVNQAPITGESLPVEKNIGDKVFAGTINQQGSFTYRVDTLSGDTTLARIIRVVESAQGSRAPIQRFIDKFSLIYTPIVFLIALAVALIPPLVMAQPWLDWIYKGLVLLVIACPCALVISTPVTVVSGLTAAARRGILIKGGIYLELGRKLRWIALDKTGTITQGKPAQTDFRPTEGQDKQTVQQLAASLAASSDHPVSLAIAQAARQQNISTLKVSGFNALLGRGTQGVIDNKRYYLGNALLMKELNLLTPHYRTLVEQTEQQGKTVILFADGSQILALFAVADTLRAESLEAISQIHQQGVKAIMLTGDNDSVAQAIAKQVGIDAVYSQLLPEDKLTIIAQKVDGGEVVGMVGDGINDAPALAKADIGFAMGGIGTDTAIETADVTLMGDDLRKIPEFLRLSQKTYAILIQNITLALGLKILFLILTLVGLGSMWMAVFADVGTTMLVILNGLRLLKKTDG
jgi:Cd2+/Zn2+-exporting ATPase